MIPRIEDNSDFRSCFSAKKGVFVAFIGYEARSIFLTKIAYELEVNSPILATLEGNADTHSLVENKELISQFGFKLVEFPRSNVRKLAVTVLRQVRDEMRKCPDKRLAVHVDYSSMPRDWYCILFLKLIRFQRLQVYGWYAAGRYSLHESYPCVGIGKWEIFCAGGRIASKGRAVLLGLGLDWVRSNGILDISNASEYYAVAAIPTKSKNNSWKSKIENTLQALNWEILAEAQGSVRLPLEEFSRIFHGIRDLILHLVGDVDVEVIPDGPKPLVLAMSLAAATSEKKGIHCWHVRHAANAPRLDVWAVGEDHIHGFVISNGR